MIPYLALLVLGALVLMGLWLAMGKDVVDETVATVLRKLPFRIKAKLWVGMPLTVKDEQWMDRAIAEMEQDKKDGKSMRAGGKG